MEGIEKSWKWLSAQVQVNIGFKISLKFSPVRYCLNQPVQVHSGLPLRRGYMQSRCKVEAGKTASTPDGSYAADPTPTLILIDGGLSSE